MDTDQKDLLLAIGAGLVGFTWMVGVLLMSYSWSFPH